MKNTFGSSIALTLFGESHGKAVGVVIDGLAPGLEVSEAEISRCLLRRSPSMNTDTTRREKDDFEILSGVFNGRTTGTPITVVIPNEDAHSADYSYGTARPSHADYTGYCKYHGFEDYRGGGHFSGRVTAPLAAAGAIFASALKGLGIGSCTHILRCGGVDDRGFEDISADIRLLEFRDFPVLDSSAGEKMRRAILDAKSQGDSIGGITQTAVYGVPSGLGEPWFDSVEGVLSHALFSVGGIKGVEFGSGFACADIRGTRFNDPLRAENGRVYSTSNHSGGINGGITNGMPIIFQCAVRPTASIAAEQQTVDFLKNENAEISVQGRHDPAIIRRICPVIDSITAFVVCDLLAGRYGTDIFTRGFD